MGTLTYVQEEIAEFQTRQKKGQKDNIVRQRVLKMKFVPPSWLE